MKNRALMISVMWSLMGVGALASVANQDAGVELPDEVVELLFGETCRKGCSEEEVALWKSNLKFKSHDLNADGVAELFLYIDHSDWCGAGGNCSYWVYQKTGAGYKLLLNDKVLKVKDSVSNGYRDLSSETPWGFCEGAVRRLYVTPYRYDGREYRAQKRRVECRALTPKGN